MAFGDFTVDRASKKYVLGADGFLKEYANDEPAIEFNPDGSYKGVLVEPQSVNEARASEDLDNTTYWTATRTTIAGDTETDPKGGTNSFLLSETVDNNTHFFVGQVATNRVAVATSETWTQSIFVKKGDGVNAPDIIQLRQPSAAFPTNYVNFDISVGGGTSGTVTASTGGTAGIRDYGNGWYRISWTSTSTTSGTATNYIAFCNNNPTATAATVYAGQTDANVFVWGAQLEASPIATSYIPTTTGAVTRLADQIYLDSATSLIGQTEGTVFIDVEWGAYIASTTANTYFLSLMPTAGTGVQSSGIGIGVTFNTNKIRGGIFGVTNTFLQEIDPTNAGIYKLAIPYKLNDSALYANGSIVGSVDTLVDIPAALDKIYFNRYTDFSVGAVFHIRAVALFTSRLTDTECEDLTTI